MTAAKPRRHAASEAFALLIPFVFALSPLASMLIATQETMPPPIESQLRMVALLAALVAVGYLGARALGASVARASNMLALPTLLVGVYPFAVQAASHVYSGAESWLAWTYLIACAASACAALIVTEPVTTTWHHVLRRIAIVFAVLTAGVVVGPLTSRLSPDVTNEIAKLSAPLPIPTRVDHRPDVYHIVLDSFGRADVLDARYGMNLAPTVSEFRRLGFVVYDAAYANYVQTHLTLASMLNVTYVNSLEAVEGASNDRRPLRALIDHARVPEVFSRLGYRVVQIGTGSHSQGVFARADACDCPQLWWSEPELGVTSLTPMKVFLQFGFEQPQYLRRANHIFDSFGASAQGDPPRYVYAHVMMPHPPFYADARGQFVKQTRPATGADATFFPGTSAEYVAGYRGQATYVIARTLDACQRLIAASRRQGREAIVIVHGDHGPRLGMDARNPAADSGRFTLPVFLAIRWPQTMTPSAAPRSLVNVYRTLFRQAFMMELPPLSDAGYVSGFTTPYKLMPVDRLE